MNADGKGESEERSEVEVLRDYLAGTLSEDAKEELERKLRDDPRLRRQLADLILIDALFNLAASRPDEKSCRGVRALFAEYREGRASAGETARLSRHLESCEACTKAFEDRPNPKVRAKLIGLFVGLLLGILLGFLLARLF